MPAHHCSDLLPAEGPDAGDLVKDSYVLPGWVFPAFADCL